MEQAFRVLLLLIALSGMAASLRAADAPDAEELTRMLHAFLAGATVNDPVAHNRFWADDLIYTSSTGERFGKTEIMEGLSAEAEVSSTGASTEASADASAEAVLVYSAEDIRIQQYDDTAIVAFTLVGTKPADAGSAPASGQRFFNTGTFLRRDGIWQVVAWQATRIPAPNPSTAQSTQ